MANYRSIVSLVYHLWLSSYKFSKFLVLIQHPWTGPFLVVFGPWLSQMCSDLAETFTGGSIPGDKNSVWRIF